MVWRTVHVNHAKPGQSPTLVAFLSPQYLHHQLFCRKSTARGIWSWRKPPPPQPAAPVAEPSKPHATAPPASPSLSRPTMHAPQPSQEAAPLPEQRSPPPQPRANENLRSGPPLRRSERLKAANRPIDRPTQAAPAHSQPSINMARTFPYSLSYDACHWG